MWADVITNPLLVQSYFASLWPETKCVLAKFSFEQLCAAGLISLDVLIGYGAFFFFFFFLPLSQLWSALLYSKNSWLPHPWERYVCADGWFCSCLSRAFAVWAFVCEVRWYPQIKKKNNTECHHSLFITPVWHQAFRP